MYKVLMSMMIKKNQKHLHWAEATLKKERAQRKRSAAELALFLKNNSQLYQ